MKRFTKLNKFTQWLIAIGFTVILCLVLFAWVRMVSETKLWALLIFIIVPIIQFLITPLCTILGLYTYYSPMVVSFGSNASVVDLHNGSSFDYLLEMRGIKPGMQWKSKMLQHYLNALLNIIQQIENGDLSGNTIIRGSSYFLSERSATKLGFKVKNTSLAERVNIALNYVDLVWMYSLTNGKLTFPDLTKISTVSITGSELIASKQRIQDLINRLTW